nr:hypothetical protein [Tanacetum cinerariifolium]
MPTEPSRHAESPSLDEEVPKINAGDQDEGQAGPKPSEHDEDQAGSNPCDAENLKLLIEDQVILEDPTSSTGTLSSLQNLDKELSFTNQFLVEKPQEEEPGKTNTESQVQSMVTVPILQDTSLVPPMTTPEIDLAVHAESPSLDEEVPEINAGDQDEGQAGPKPSEHDEDQAGSNPCKHEKHLADLLQNNLALEERLDKHGSRLYNLENLNIPHQVRKAVDEIVTDVLDWTMQAPLRAYFSDLPVKSLENDYSNQHLSDLEAARQMKRKRCNSPRTPLGSPPSQPPPLPPTTGASGALGTSGASGSSQFPLSPPPPSTGTSRFAQQQGSKASSSSKTAASTSQSMAWTTSDTRYESTSVSAAQESSPTDSMINDDSITDEQIQLSDDEDIGNDQLPKADTRKDWWKPLPTEERPATPEPAWTISINNNSHNNHNKNNSSPTTTSSSTKHHRFDLITTHRKAVDEIVTDVLDWTMQAPLRAYFSDLPVKSLENDYSNQHLSDLEAARQMKRKRCNSPRTPLGSPPSHPPPLPPTTGASGALGTSGASGSSQFPLSPPPPSTGTSRFAQQQGKSSPTDFMINDDSITDEQIQLSEDEDIENDQLPKADTRKDWWKPLPTEERPATPEPAW